MLPALPSASNDGFYSLAAALELTTAGPSIEVVRCETQETGEMTNLLSLRNTGQCKDGQLNMLWQSPPATDYPGQIGVDNGAREKALGGRGRLIFKVGHH
jgi:hypothetical protein